MTFLSRAKLCFIVSGCLLASQGKAENYRYSANIEPVEFDFKSSSFSIRANVGDVKIIGWNKPFLKIGGKKTVDSEVKLDEADAEELLSQLTFSFSEGNLLSGAKLDVKDGFFGPKNNSFFDVVLYIPKKTSLDIETDIGDVSIVDLEPRRISIKTDLGDIKIPKMFPETRDTKIETDMGDVSIGFPRRMSVRISAYTSDGEIESWDGDGYRKLKTQMNGGNNQVKVRSEDGDFEFWKVLF